MAAPAAIVERRLRSWGDAVIEPVDTSTSSAHNAMVEATRLSMEVDDLYWVVLMLAAVDAEILHIDPPELRSFLHRIGTRFAAINKPQQGAP